MTHHQLRAARALLVLRQELLAHKAEVGITTLRLFENGNRVGQGIVEKLQKVVEEAGAILVASDTLVDGVPRGVGVVLKREAELPPDTMERIKAFNMTSEEAARSSPKKTGTGRRARVPLSNEVREKFGMKPVDAPDGEDGTPSD